MALYGVVSAGGSAGATTTALALALSWPRQVVLAECDPAGGSVLAGFMAERLPGPPGPGLLGLAMHLARGFQPVRIEDYTIRLTDRAHIGHPAVLLPGICDPSHARQLTPLWPPLAAAMTSAGTDVIADLGRIGGADTPAGLLAATDLVVMVLRRTLTQVNAAQPRLQGLRRALPDSARLGLCLIDSGPYSTRAVRKALSGLPVFAQLPYAPADAGVLSDGRPAHLAFRTSLLMRSAAILGNQIRKQVEERAFHPGSALQAIPRTPGARR
ncbi:hypothetical protein GCM10027176_51720 [Actinoallomurus bryophytorum]|uniref:MinD-like ATPase involved in chromosome partitioning or flagellar assembly n=1 Tax=Actinoallomurus bryophytorum TaxID=1490222 RepID=A0A543CHU4_9ACTN|nr:hypothetical protein [Actinoallomurus bryophytorum]TQL96590.1 hypothetical protein FB559_2129 [Actinoallomurus bryophytorum]